MAMVLFWLAVALVVYSVVPHIYHSKAILEIVEPPLPESKLGVEPLYL